MVGVGRSPISTELTMWVVAGASVDFSGADREADTTTPSSARATEVRVISYAVVSPAETPIFSKRTPTYPRFSTTTS